MSREVPLPEDMSEPEREQFLADYSVAREQATVNQIFRTIVRRETTQEFNDFVNAQTRGVRLVSEETQRARLIRKLDDHAIVALEGVHAAWLAHRNLRLDRE